MSPVRRHASLVLGGIAAFQIGALVMNTWVNPLRVTPAPWSSPDFEPYRDISSQIRTGKAGIIRSHDHVDVAFLGSSRVENGLDPEIPAWSGKEVLNLGCSGGYIYESTGIADYLLERSNPEVLFCGIDPGDLSRSMDSRDKSDYYASPFADSKDSIDRELRYLFGVSTLETAIETIKRRANGYPSPYTSRGLRGVDLGENQGTQLGFIRRQLIGNDFGGGDARDAGRILEKKVEALRKLMLKCRASGVRLILFYHPQHVVMTARSEDAENPPIFFQKERPAILAIVDEANAESLPGPPVELWDFFDFHPINCERLPLGDLTRMTYWDDLGHFTVEVGNAMQARMMGWPVELNEASDYGFHLTSSNLEVREQQIRDGYRHYLEGPGGKDVAWKEDLLGGKSKR
jgi:hypothetical protein